MTKIDYSVPETKETFVGFVTKYALTDGIIETTLMVGSYSPSIAKTNDRFPAYLHDEGKDWHRTRESAVVRAELLRAKRIKALEKSLAKIKKLTF